MNAGLLLLLTVAVPPPEGPREASRAAPLAVSAVGECPGEAAVTAALLPLIKLESVRNGEGHLRVTDLGDRFEVTAAGQVGLYADPGRDCSERARVTAVFMALALNPPAFQTRPPRPASPGVPARKDDRGDDRKDDRTEDRSDRKDEKRDEAIPAKPPVADVPAPPGPPAQPWAHLMLSGRLETAPETSGRPTTTLGVGLDLSAAAGLDDLGLLFGAGVRAPTVNTFSGVSIREQRIPLCLAAVGRYPVANSLELVGDAGMSLVVLRLRDESPGGVAPATRLDVGFRAGLALRFPPVWARWSPFVGVGMEYFPRPYRYQVAPLGEIGTSAPFWLGATLGLSFRAQ